MRVMFLSPVFEALDALDYLGARCFLGFHILINNLPRIKLKANQHSKIFQQNCNYPFCEYSKVRETYSSFATKATLENLP